jgi:hypothetical protein
MFEAQAMIIGYQRMPLPLQDPPKWDDSKGSPLHQYLTLNG